MCIVILFVTNKKFDMIIDMIIVLVVVVVVIVIDVDVNITLQFVCRCCAIARSSYQL